MAACRLRLRLLMALSWHGNSNSAFTHHSFVHCCTHYHLCFAPPRGSVTPHTRLFNAIYATMSSYTPLDTTESPTRRSFASLRRPSMSSLRFGSHRQNRIPDPDEMDAAFDAPDDEGETHGLLGGRQNSQPIPGDYDFERDYVSHLTHSPFVALSVGNTGHDHQLIHRPNRLHHLLRSSLTRRTIRHRVTPMVSCHRHLYIDPLPRPDIS